MPIQNNNTKTVIEAIEEGNGKTISVEIEPLKLGSGIEAVFEWLNPLVSMDVS